MGEETKDRLQIPVTAYLKKKTEERATELQQPVAAYVRALIVSDIESSKK